MAKTEKWVEEYSALAERESSPALRFMLGQKHWSQLAERPSAVAAHIALESSAGLECLLIVGFEHASQKAGSIYKTDRLNQSDLDAGFEASCIALIASCMGREALGLGITPRSGRNATMLCFSCGLAEDVLPESLKSSMCEVLEAMGVGADQLKSWQSRALNGDLQSSLINLAEDVGSALASCLEKRALDRHVKPGLESRARSRI